VIRWPAWPTEVIPAHLPHAVAAACWILAQLQSEGLDQSADAMLGRVVRPGSDMWLVVVNANAQSS